MDVNDWVVVAVRGSEKFGEVLGSRDFLFDIIYFFD